MTKFGRITHGEGIFLGVSHVPTTVGLGPNASQFWGFPYIYAHTP